MGETEGEQSWHDATVHGHVEGEALLTFDHEVNGVAPGVWLSHDLHTHEYRVHDGSTHPPPRPTPPKAKRQRKTESKCQPNPDDVEVEEGGHAAAASSTPDAPVEEGADGDEWEESTDPPAETDPSTAEADLEICVRDMAVEQVDQLERGELAALLRRRRGETHDVLPNGTCWLYAVLGGMGVLEHSRPLHKSLPSVPTSRDVRFSEILLAEMKTHFLSMQVPTKAKRAANPKGVTTAQSEYARLMSVVKLQNVWVPSMKTKSAKMGGQEQLALLARVLDRVIVVLNGPALRALTAKPRKTDMRAEGKVHHSHHPRATRLQPRTINTIGVLCLLEDEEDAIVIVHDGDLHYMCLRRPGEPTSSELPRCLVKGWPASADK